MKEGRKTPPLSLLRAAKQRAINQTMAQQSEEIRAMLLRIEGYLKLTKKTSGLSSATFGVSALRKTLNDLYVRMSEIFSIGKVLSFF
jgi:hypothetical protein